MRNRTAILAALALAISGVSIGCQNDNGDSRGERVDRIGLDPRDTRDLDTTQNVAGARTGVGQGGVPRQNSTGMTNTEAGEPLTTDVEPTPAAGTVTRDEADARQRNIDATRLDQDVAGGGVSPGATAGDRRDVTGRENVDRATEQRDTDDRNDTIIIDRDDDNDDDNDDDADATGVRIERRPVPGTANDRMNDNTRQPAQRPTGADRTDQNRTGTGITTTRPSN